MRFQKFHETFQCLIIIDNVNSQEPYVHCTVLVLLLAFFFLGVGLGISSVAFLFECLVYKIMVSHENLKKYI